MKAWADTLILASVFGIVVKVILPKGEKSPLFGPTKLLISLILIVVMFSPILSLFNKETTLPFLSDSLGEALEVNSEQLLLERSCKIMSDEVKSAFPQTRFSLEIYTDDNRIPTQIQVICDPPEEGPRIADFLQAKYAIPASAKEKE